MKNQPTSESKVEDHITIRDRKLTFGSLFAGIGGMDLGLERSGLECRWQVEINPFCRAVLEKHWPHVKRYEDIKTVDFHALEKVDVISGGFPCQDVSLAGERRGFEGERSSLWFQWYCRYYIGRRIPDEDIRQIKRWKAIKRHIAQIAHNCRVGDEFCRSKQRQAVLHWAYDSRRI
jgi:hypothetical protein